MSDTELDPQAFAGAFHEFVKQMSALAPTKEPELRVRIREHFGGDPAQL